MTARKMRKVSLVSFAAMVFSLSANADTNIVEAVRLADGVDWRGLGTVTVCKGAAIDLDGHTLQVDGITGGFKACVDATTGSGAVESPTTIASGSVAFLFDNEFRYTYNTASPGDTTKNHRVCVNDSALPFVVTYDFGEGNETCIRAYRMHYDSLMRDNSRAPKNWTFEGSNDKDTWHALDERSNMTDWKQPDARTFSFGNVTAFRYYRLSVTAVVSGNVMELFQLEYFPEAQEVCDETANAPGRVTASAITSGDAAFLFDNNFRYTANPTDSGDPAKNHRILARTMPFDVTYDFGADNAILLNGYRIYHNSSSQTVNGRAPFDWEFQGSCDNLDWVSLDSHLNDTNWVKGGSRTFLFANATPYRYYRLHVTRCGIDGILEMYQLEFLSKPMVFSLGSQKGVDLTEPGSGHLSVSSTPKAGSVENLFDNEFSYSYNDNHRILVEKGKLPFDVIYDFGEGKNARVTAYKMYYDTVMGNSSRAPTAWTFAGSNDGSVWQPLDSREVQEDGWTCPDEQIFSFDNSQSFRFYRLHFTACGSNNYIELYQLEYFNFGLGSLKVDVPSNVSQTNDLLSLCGQLRLVKDGAGDFTIAEPGQTYSGGTIISNGTLIAGIAGDDAPLGIFNESDGDASCVTICSNGTFDVNGFCGWWRYPVRLAGGTLACRMAQDVAPEATFRNIVLDADSSLVVSGNFIMGDGSGEEGILDLGGHVLTASVSRDGLWTFNMPLLTAGTIAFNLDRADAYADKKVMSWEPGERPADVSFVQANGGHYAVAARGDGVYAVGRGMAIILR